MDLLGSQGRFGSTENSIARSPSQSDSRTPGRFQQVWEISWKHPGLLQPVIKVGCERDSVLVNILEQFDSKRRQTRLGIPIRRGTITVHRPEIPLPINNWLAKRKRLDHPYHGVVYRRITMGMVLAENIANHRRRFLNRPTGK